MTSDLMRGMWAQTHRERPRDDGHRDWDGEATSPGLLESLEAGMGRKAPPLGSLGGSAAL